MKIGKFVEYNNLTIDTVRHYVDMNLIIPEKQGGQYNFDERCQRDIDDILSLKGMGFLLSEIKSILMFKRLAQLTQYQEDECFKSLFVNKNNQLENQLKELSEMKQRLENKLTDFTEMKNNNKSIIGMDIKALNLLGCLKCGNNLELAEGNIMKNQIINGKLICSCGEEYLIVDGILKVTNTKTNNINLDYNYINDYISDTNIDYLDNVYKGIDWIYKKTDFMNFKNKVILELGSGMGFFLRNIYKDLPDDTIYIAVDHDINMLIFLKNILETVNCRKNMLFICSDFQKIPLRDKCVDILLDISGTSNYSFDNDEFLLNLVDNYVKDNANIIGTYILFKNFNFNSLIEEKYRKNFMINNVKEHISKLKYNIIDDNISNYMEKGGKYESYFKDGEKVYSYLILGQR